MPRTGETLSDDPGTMESLISLHARDAAVDHLLARLQRATGMEIYARGKVAGQRVPAFSAREVPAREALRRLAEAHNWVLHQPQETPHTIEVWDRESYQQTVLPRMARFKVFVPQSITAEEAAQAVRGILTPGIGTAIFDARSNKLIITDLPYALERVQNLLNHIDVSYMTRVFRVARTDVEALAEKLAGLKSPAAPDMMIDVRNHQIIVQDRPEVIRKMERLLETLDYGSRTGMAGRGLRR